MSGDVAIDSDPTPAAGIERPRRGRKPEPRRHPEMSESDFQAMVVDLARRCGWLVAHFRPARTAEGWRTPVQYDGKGFPDLVLVHPEYGVLFRELKRRGKKLEPEQRRWAKAIRAAGGNWQTWWPDDWPEIVDELTGGRGVAQ